MSIACETNKYTNLLGHKIYYSNCDIVLLNSSFSFLDNLTYIDIKGGNPRVDFLIKLSFLQKT